MSSQSQVSPFDPVTIMLVFRLYISDAGLRARLKFSFPPTTLTRCPLCRRPAVPRVVAVFHHALSPTFNHDDRDVSPPPPRSSTPGIRPI